MDVAQLWAFFPLGYLITILIETPVLAVGLSPVHSLSRRVFAGLWLTACTYPIVVLVLPLLMRADKHRMAYLIVAETFAPLAECALFALAFLGERGHSIRSRCRDYATIVTANLLSFGLGEMMHRH